MADQEVVKHVKAAIAASRDKNKSWKHKLQEILLEVGIIVFAVSLSIWLHGWAEDRKDHQEEREFLLGLRQDLQADVKEMMGDRDTYSYCLKGVKYFERVGAGEKLNPDSLEAYVWTLDNETQISPRISRFEALKGSGRMSIVGNKELLLRITELYTKDFFLIVELNDYVAHLKQNLIVPFLAAHVQLGVNGKGVNWDRLLLMSQMRILIGQEETVVHNVEAYKAGIADCQRIIGEIGKEVE